MSPLGSVARVAVIGAGKMGETLMRGLVDTNTLEAGRLVATARHPERLERVKAMVPGIETSLDNRSAARDANVVLVCVKPQVAASVLADLAPVVGPNQVVLSILASVPTSFLETRLAPGVPVIRAMPNTPTLIGAGMTALCPGRHATGAQLEQARALFAPLGATSFIDEKHFDAVTGLSASGPAFLYIVIESLADGGVKAGLPRNVAIQLAAQTCLGAARMVLETGQHPALLKDAVTTPAGCTIDGILALEEGGLRVTLIKAIVEAARRAGELVREAEG
jgi:pyrroline-5-carboxylate reductase